MKTFNTVLAAATAIALTAGVSFADTAAPAAAAKMAPAAQSSTASKPVSKISMQKPVQSEASKSCSAQADAKNLHGQPRREFRQSCLKAANAAAKPAKANVQKANDTKPASNAPATASH